MSEPKVSEVSEAQRASGLRRSSFDRTFGPTHGRTRGSIDGSRATLRVAR